MDQSIALLLHVLSVVVWVGGMFFAYLALRPAAAQTLEPPQRLSLWAATFERFFPWVWLSIVLLLGSGFYLIAIYGGLGAMGVHVRSMLTLGIIMMLIFFQVYFAQYKRLKISVSSQQWPAAGATLAQMRILIGVNLSIGIFTIFVAMLGKYWI